MAIAIIIIILLSAVLGFMVWASASIGSGVYLKAFCREKTDDKVVYLTFDDGPVRGRTEKVLDVLKSRGAKATFFLIGSKVNGNEDIVLNILANEHHIGIHSYTHKNTFPLLSLDAMCEELYYCQSLLESLACRTVQFFRPPFGVVNPTVAKAVKICGLKTIGWNVRSFDTVDIDKKNGRKIILDRIMKQVKAGSVILLHDRLPDEELLVTELLDRLDAEGYRYDRPLPFKSPRHNCK